MSLQLADVFPFDELKEYKTHVASWNGKSQPLDVFVRDKAEWKRWNTWRSSRNDFNRPYIFSLIDFYPENNTWLFGGIFEVISRSEVDKAHSYEVKRLEQGEDFIGRLKVRFDRPGRARVIKLEKYVPEMAVSELLKKPYNGEAFVGLESISHDFNQLETIFRVGRRDWRAALESVKGVYLVADKNNGKCYVGSAYGESGIWARWQCYMDTGHGWNDELTELIDEKGMDYARQNFRFSLLEYMPARTDDSTIIARENHWKEALLSRSSEFGYNRN